MDDWQKQKSPLWRSVLMDMQDNISEATLPQERRQACCNTLQSSISGNETLKNVLESYNSSKLSHKNAWNASIIDTFSNLMDKHTKLNNLKVAGSALEASSKVYGMRVDSMYADVVRMSAGLKTTIASDLRNIYGKDDYDNVKTVEQNGNVVPPDGREGNAKPRKKTKKVNSTIVKNKNSLNARLDTVPLQDPIFGKWNCTVGDINDPKRLMTTILPTKDSELLLHTNYPFWDESDFSKALHYPEEMKPEELKLENWINADWIEQLENNKNLRLRRRHGGYETMDTTHPIDRPNVEADGQNTCKNLSQNILDICRAGIDLSMAFDIDAECEPIPDLDATPQVLKCGMNDLEEFTTDERAELQIGHIMKKAASVVDDLRPTDGKSKLEYSYRPMDNISHHWAGPSYWKLKGTQTRSVSQIPKAAGSSAAKRAPRSKQLQAKSRSQPLNFGEYNEENFIDFATSSEAKLRNINVQKQWDPRKLSLPTKLNIDKILFFKYEYAPGLKDSLGFEKKNYGTDADDVGDFGNENVAGQRGVNHGSNLDLIETLDFNLNIGASVPPFSDSDTMFDDNNMPNIVDETVLEIPTEFENAPQQITRVSVPVARCEEICDMKDLKYWFTQIINKELEEHGHASFKEILTQLCEAKPDMTKSLSKPEAFFAILSLANELGLHLTSQEDLDDFVITKVQD